MELMVSVTTKGTLLEGKAPSVIQRHTDRFIVNATMFLLAEVKKRTPQGVGGAKGGLLASIQPDVLGKGTPIVKGIVASAAKHALVIEKGRRPGKSMPPKGSLLDWLQLKLGLDAKSAQRIEYVVRRKIGQKGFEGAHMFEKALTENLPKLQQMAEAEGLALAVDLNG
jgi:hypothetical protein